MASSSSLVLVHAHPDDEALFSAGTIAHYARRGRRVVLVTCTDGRLGLDQHARAGNDPRHDPTTVAATRAGELARSAAIVGVARHVTLGYHDSGLSGWGSDEDPSAFVNADVAAVARTLTSIFDEEDARVVVTYDPSGYYGHPDHVRAHEVTRRAVVSSGCVERLYYPVTPREALVDFVARARASGVQLPLWVLDAGDGTESGDIAVTIDARGLTDIKRAAIAAHASQVDNADLVTMGDELFRLLFGREHYQLGWARTGGSGELDDLFGGLT